MILFSGKPETDWLRPAIKITQPLAASRLKAEQETGVRVRKANVVATVALLLGFAQACLAAGPRDDDFENIWSALGPRTEIELATLSAKARGVFERTLVACSIFVDMYTNPKYTSECEATASEFLTQYSNSSSALSILFTQAIELTRDYNVQAEFDGQRRRALSFDNPGKVYVDVLQRAYRDTITRRF